MINKVLKFIRTIIVSKKATTYSGFHSSIMPEIRPLTQGELNNPLFIDRTGDTKGKLVVLGKTVKAGRHWVVRCSCGKYETRTAKALSNSLNINDRCSECHGMAVSKNRAHFIRTGEMLGTNFFMEARG